jgi:hypothetical protein
MTTVLEYSLSLACISLLYTRQTTCYSNIKQIVKNIVRLFHYKYKAYLFLRVLEYIYM